MDLLSETPSVERQERGEGERQNKPVLLYRAGEQPEGALPDGRIAMPLSLKLGVDRKNEKSKGVCKGFYDVTEEDGEAEDGEAGSKGMSTKHHDRKREPKNVKIGNK